MITDHTVCVSSPPVTFCLQDPSAQMTVRISAWAGQRPKCADDSKNFSVGGTNRDKSSSIDVHTRPCVEETASGKLQGSQLSVL